ncbi:DNA polymerase-like protein PA0670 [hydrothermal vent metagenome]|uniref:DNA polymerase-like protein PA0670 n=1 Tax=hydrothermal vent metagenome TaxID=652676 RepID=A0A3B0TM29_9ZZZZ
MPSERAQRLRPVKGPFVLTHFHKNTQRIYCFNIEAQKAGIGQDMSFADARAMYPDILSDLADPIGDMNFLRILSRWTERYCPFVGLDGTDGLLLDISGAAHLFGGERAMLDDLLARLQKAGLSSSIAIADTRGAAWAMSHYSQKSHYGPNQQSGTIIEVGHSLSVLANLPVAALQLADKTIHSLRRLGISTVHDLSQIPRVTLSRRFGASLLLQLDRASGAQPDPIELQKRQTGFAARMTLPEPIGLTEDVMGIVERLMHAICKKLEAAQMGARRLGLSAQRVDQNTIHAEIGLARPMRDAPRMTKLFTRTVEAMDAGFGIERIRLEVVEAENLKFTQISHMDKKAAASDALADLISRIGNRVGFENIVRYLPAQSHIPEKSFLIVAAAYSEAAQNWHPAGERPLIIFPPESIAATGANPPQHFRWRNMRLTLAEALGPERLLPEWWLDNPNWRSGMRDYWRVQTHQGRRLWLFFTPQNPNWFVQGEFA